MTLSIRLTTVMTVFVAAGAICASAGAQDEPAADGVRVVDGIVLPRQRVSDAIEQAMQFLKKADDGYVPGRIDGDLAGYFTSAFVNEDGSRSDRQLAFPARQHAYFIRTFLHYYAYGGQPEWLLRARDLADWNLAHSTPPDAAYANLPYSTFSNGKPGGSADRDSTEPDKAAFIGSAYVALYEALQQDDRDGAAKYLAGAKAIAQTLARRQNDDGSWPFRVLPVDGQVRQEFGGAPVFFVEFFEDLLRHTEDRQFRHARDRALSLMLQRNVEQNLWGTYHEDIREKPKDYLSAEPICFTADYLFRHAEAHPEYVEMGRKILRSLEDHLVHVAGHPAAPAPAVSEQADFEHMMPGHTARYCLALARLHAATGDERAKRQATSGINALTYMQSPHGLFRTYFQRRNERQPGRVRPNWYSQHLYTVCHVLEAMPLLPEIHPQ